MQSSRINGFDVYTIISKDGNTQASFVPEKGGVGSSLIMPDRGVRRELLFQHDHFWERDNKHLPGGLPFLFPICARLERNGVMGDYLYDGHVYNMPIHGFAPYLPWEVNAHAKDSITLKLCSTPQTLAMYPFNFCVELTYKVADKILTCEQCYTNAGDRPLPHYAGFHPYFLTSPAGQEKAKVSVYFDAARHFKCNDKLTDVIGEQALLTMPASIADPLLNEQLHFLGKNKTVTLTYPDGFALEMAAGGLFNYLQVYTQAQEPFICLEPWMAFPNALNTVQGVRWLPAQQSERAVLSVKCR